MSAISQWKGRTFHLDSGTQHDPNKKHLFIVVTEPQGDEVLAVPISSTRDKDGTCVIEPNGHPFIKKISYVQYAFLEKIRIRFLETQDEDVRISDKLLGRICGGIENSDHTKPKMKEFYKSSQ